jgi:hypothetical protein
MLESFAVKEILRLLLVFTALFILVSVLFAALGLLGFLGRLYAAKSIPQLSMVLARLPALFLERLPLALSATLLLLLARSGLHPGRSFPAFILVAVTCFALLVFLSPLLERTAAPGHGSEAAESVPLLAPGYWHSLGGRAYYLETGREGGRQSLLVVDPAQKQSRLRYTTTPGGTAPFSEAASGPGDAGFPGGPAFPAAFTPERFTVRLDQDLRLLNRELSASRAAGQPRYLLFCFALVFAFMAAVFLMRLSRWPLLNLFLSFAALRFEFYLFRLLREVIADELSTLITGEVLLEILPVLGLLLLAGLLLLLHLLFLPARRRGEAVSG